VTIGFGGVVRNDGYGFAAGDAATGYYVYDTSAVDTATRIDLGCYEFSQSPFGMYLEINGHVWQTDPLQISYHVEIIDGDLSQPMSYDTYSARSYTNVYNYSQPDGGPFYDFGLYLGLYGISSDAVISDSLPLTAPDLSKFDYKFISIDWDPHNSMYVDITDMWVVPEPAMFGLLAFGSLLLRRKKRTRNS
jgi:hypothetical protein